MASVFIKGDKWWGRLKGYKGRPGWSSIPTPFKAREPERDKALRFTIAAQKRIDAHLALETGPLTVADYAKQWLTAREGRGIETVGDDVGRINNHVLPIIGRMRLDEVRPRHIRDMVRTFQMDPDLAPRTILNIYGVVRTMFHDAITDELIQSTPCVLKAGELPSKIDKDPEWRDLATFAGDEVLLLLSSPLVPPERRVQYAFKALGGLRHGEVAGLLWRHHKPDEQPLGKLSVTRSYEKKRTKTEVTRLVPVHPLLARILELWRTEHWARIYGRAPGEDDFIVPTRNLTPVQASEAVSTMKDDLLRLDLRVDAGEHRDRGGHDLRAWFITTSLEHGASMEALMRVTHTKRKDVVSGYNRVPWPAICEAVGKLRIAVDGDPLALATDFATRERNAGLRWKRSATPTGFEPSLMRPDDRGSALSTSGTTVLVTSHDSSRAALVASLLPVNPDPDDQGPT